MVVRLLGFLKRQQNNIWELLWASIWHDTIRGIDWIQNLGSISPGRFAVGYNYLYVMTRILEEKRPQHVLDIGLGISSTLISSFFEANGCEQSEHIIVEHDQSWGDFYISKHRLSKYSTIKYVKRVLLKDSGDEYYAYDGLDKVLQGKKFSVISIDAPQGGRKNKYARRDILKVLPDILEESWLILIDDSERKGEKRTIQDIKSILNANGIKYCEGVYKGATHLSVLTSDDNRFLCSL